jgi:hypothetical protein
LYQPCHPRLAITLNQTSTRSDMTRASNRQRLRVWDQFVLFLFQGQLAGKNDSAAVASCEFESSQPVRARTL